VVPVSVVGGDRGGVHRGAKKELPGYSVNSLSECPQGFRSAGPVRQTECKEAFDMRRGFTLIELLVVIAIIAILAAILFPVFARAREKARSSACLSNVKQISLGIQMYVQDYDELLPPYRQGSSSIYWQHMVTPYLKNDQILKCPSRLHNTSAVHYGYNYDIDMWSLAVIDAPSETCWINDSRNNLSHHPPMADTTTFDLFLQGMNIDQSPRVAQAPHNDGLNLGFVDGHSKWIAARSAWDNTSTYWPQ
jgi:prepilin-type N-terminal cleavage/methylation domain-containing protein/prepilin-type processing-associated H-X9-DG protein